MLALSLEQLVAEKAGSGRDEQFVQSVLDGFKKLDVALLEHIENLQGVQDSDYPQELSPGKRGVMKGVVKVFNEALNSTKVPSSTSDRRFEEGEWGERSFACVLPVPFCVICRLPS